MALQNTIDTSAVESRLASWLSANTPGAPQVQVANLMVPASAGLSNETVLFDASWDTGSQAHSAAMVARVAPRGPGVFPSYDLGKEARVLRALGGHTSVPVPEVHFYSDDSAVFGAPFIVMERVDGRVPSDDPPFTAGGWVLDLTAEQRRAMWHNGIDAMARIHSADWRALGLDDLDPAPHADGLAAQIAHWRGFFDWAAEGEANPTLEFALNWLADNRPTDIGPKVLNWGDARVGNLIVADDLSIAAVLDWEMVTVANRELDLGWWFFLERHHTEGIGLPLPDGIPERGAAIAHYEELTGHTVANLDYFEIFAGTRLAIIMVRAAHMMIAAGLLPPDAPMALSNPASQLLARLLDLPAPAGTSTSFIGNR